MWNPLQFYDMSNRDYTYKHQKLKRIQMFYKRSRVQSLVKGIVLLLVAKLGRRNRRDLTYVLPREVTFALLSLRL